MEAVIGFSLGLLIGLLLQGIRITIQHKEKKAPTEYNKSVSMDMPPEYKQYIDQNRGWVE